MKMSKQLSLSSWRAVTQLAIRPLRTSRPRGPMGLRTSQDPSSRALQRLYATTQHLKSYSETFDGKSIDEYPKDHRQIKSPIDTRNFLNNEFTPSKTSSWIDLNDPATNNLVTRVPQSTIEELKAAVESAKKAFPAWRSTSILHRQQIMFKFVALIRQHWDRIAARITLEQGKTVADSRGEVLRGIQVAETACGITTQITGEVLEVAKDMETRSYREPLGVVAAICPFSRSRSML